MKKIKLLSVLLLFCTTIIFGQEKGEVAKLIGNAKALESSFQQVDNLLKINSNVKKSTSLSFIDQKDLIYLNYDFTKLPEQSSRISLSIPADNRQMILDLVEVDPTFYNYQVVTDKNEVHSPNMTARHYRGIIQGEENSVVALSLFENEMMGMISTDGNGTYNIGKLFDQDHHVIFNDKNVKGKTGDFCEMPYLSKQKMQYKEEMISDSDRNKSAAKCVRLYFETEYDIYNQLNSVSSVENYVTALYNQVATLYMNESIETALSEIKVWTTNDPYNGANASSTLNQFQAQTNSFNGDLGQLLTFRSIGGGIAAGFNGLCNINYDNRLSVSGNLSTIVVPVPTYSWNIMVITHEFGHLLGSRHTHACVWNGNGSAIDGCSGFTEGSCPVPGIPSNGGTIMSYCHATSAGINFNNGFGFQPGNVIRNNVSSSFCLTTCGSNPDPTCPPNQIFLYNVECRFGAGGDASASWNVNASDVDHIVWRYSIGPHSNLPLGTTTGNNSGMHAVNWNLPTPGMPIPGSWDNYNLVVKARAYLTDGTTVCSEFYKIITLNCVGGGGGGGQKVTLQPNPTTDRFNIKVEKVELVSEINVRNIYGTLVKSLKNNFNQEIDISREIGGMYFVEIKYLDGTSESKKLLLQK